MSRVDASKLTADEHALRVAAHDLAVRTRAARGLPEKVTDPSVLERVARLLLNAERRPEGAPSLRIDDDDDDRDQTESS
jgi:hypothetical protein